MVINVRRLAIFIGGVLCTLPVLAAHAVPIKANTPAAAALASATRHADILIFPKGKAEVSIPFILVEGVPVTSAVRVNGKFVGRFLIDTGSQVSMVDRLLANRVMLPVIFQRHITWKGHRVDIRRINRLQIGPITLLKAPIGAVGLSKVKNPFYRNFVGTIGGNILGRLPFTIDYRNSTLILYNPQSFRPPTGIPVYSMRITHQYKAGSQAATIFPFSGSPTLSGTLDGQPVRWGLDTGTTNAALLMPAFVNTHPDDLNWQRFIGTDNQVQLRGRLFGTRNLKIKAIGKLIGNPRHIYAIAATPWQLDLEKSVRSAFLLGGRFLRNYRLTFDYAAKKMWVQWNPPLSYQVQLAHGLDPNHADLAGETPLMHAAFHNDLAGVKALLHAGANPLAKDKSGLTVLDYATMGGNSKIIKLLLAGPARKDVNYSGAFCTPLTYAVEHKGGHAAWRELVSIGATVNPGPDPAYTPLLAAVQFDNMAAIGWLIQHDANVNGMDRDQQTPLWVSAGTGNLKAFRLLRQHGAVLHKTGPYGSSLLCAAAIGGHVAMIKFLLSRFGGGFPVNGPNSGGETSLMFAAAKGQIRAAEFLLRHGAVAETAAAARENQTALLFAAQHEQPKWGLLVTIHAVNISIVLD